MITVEVSPWLSAFLIYTLAYFGVLALCMALYGLYILYQAVAPPIWHFLEDYSDLGRTKRQVAEIRSIGQQARREMQELQEDYLAQIFTMGKR